MPSGGSSTSSTSNDLKQMMLIFLVSQMHSQVAPGNVVAPVVHAESDGAKDDHA